MFKLEVGAATVAGWTAAITAATYSGGDHDGQTRNMSAMLTATNVDGKLQLTGNRVFGDFDVYSDSITSVNIMNLSSTLNSVGVEATGIEVTSRIHTALSADMGSGAAVVAAADITTANMMDELQTTAGGTLSGTTYTFTEESALQLDLSAASTSADSTITLVGTDRDGRAVSETLTLDAGTAVNTTFQYLTITSMTANATLAADDKTLSVKTITPDDAFTFRGGREFGDFKITTTADLTTDLLSSRTVGDVDTQDYEFGVSGLVDSATVQGTIQLSSSKTFSVTQQGTENSYSSGPTNDNYFTTQSSTLNTVSNVDLRSQGSASSAIAVLDGAIERLSLIHI